MRFALNPSAVPARNGGANVKAVMAGGGSPILQQAKRREGRGNPPDARSAWPCVRGGKAPELLI